MILIYFSSYQYNDKIWLIILLKRKGPMKVKMFRGYRSHNVAPALSYSPPLPDHETHSFLSPKAPSLEDCCLIFPDYMSSLYKFSHYLVIWKWSKLYNFCLMESGTHAYLIYHYIPSTKPYMQWCETVRRKNFYCGSLKPWFRLLILNLLLYLLWLSLLI